MHGVGASSSSDGKLMVFRGGGRMDLGREGEGCDGGSNAEGYPASDEDKYRAREEGCLLLLRGTSPLDSLESLLVVLCVYGFIMGSTLPNCVSMPN